MERDKRETHRLNETDPTLAEKRGESRPNIRGCFLGQCPKSTQDQNDKNEDFAKIRKRPSASRTSQQQDGQQRRRHHRNYQNGARSRPIRRYLSGRSTPDLRQHHKEKIRKTKSIEDGGNNGGKPDDPAHHERTVHTEHFLCKGVRPTRLGKFAGHFGEAQRGQQGNDPVECEGQYGGRAGRSVSRPRKSKNAPPDNGSHPHTRGAP